MGVNLLDRKILYELDRNARATYSTIAKAVHSHRNVVAYRIKKLEEAGIIKGYFTEVNNTALGLSGYRVFFKFRNYHKETRERFLSALLQDKRVAWCFDVKGRWDIDIIYWCRDRFEFYDLLLEIENKFNSFIEKVEVSTIVTINHYPKDYLISQRRSGLQGKKVLGKSSYQINETERKIIERLSRNPRKEAHQLCKELDMSVNTFKKYLKQLLVNRIILGFRAFIDINNLGHDYFKLHLDLQNYTEQERKELISYLEYDPQVVYLDFYIGGADIEIEYHVKDMEEMNKKINTLFEKFGRFIIEYFVIQFEKEYLVNYVPVGIK